MILTTLRPLALVSRALAAFALLVVCLPGTAVAEDGAAPSPLYEITLERGFLTMPDGVRLSVTYFLPVPRSPERRSSPSHWPTRRRASSGRCSSRAVHTRTMARATRERRPDRYAFAIDPHGSRQR